jgi:hypothetical protein
MNCKSELPPWTDSVIVDLPDVSEEVLLLETSSIVIQNKMKACIRHVVTVIV